MIITEYGDLTPGCIDTGDIFDFGADQTGNLGLIRADKNGFAEFDFTLEEVDLYGPSGLLGRSIVILAGHNDLD